MFEKLKSAMGQTETPGFYYCDPIPSNYIMVKGKRKNPSQNKSLCGVSERIPNGSKYIVNVMQGAIAVENNKVIATQKNPGNYTFESLLDQTKIKKDTYISQKIFYINTGSFSTKSFGNSITPYILSIKSPTSGLTEDIALYFSGEYSYYVSDYEAFYKAFHSKMGYADLLVSDVDSVLRKEIPPYVKEAVTELLESGKLLLPLDYLDGAVEISSLVNEKMCESIKASFGINLSSVLTALRISQDIPKSAQKIDFTAGILKTSWKCSCGNDNSGKFCTECGSKRPE